jgi:hypothetical protein
MYLCLFLPAGKFFGGFLGAVKREKLREFLIFFFDMVNLNEKFYVMKVVGKIHSGIFLVSWIVNFHFRTNLEFSNRGSGVISDLPENIKFKAKQF